MIDSYEQLLADESVDVVHLTTPNHLHYAQVKQALEAGKHVVCEKPLAMTSEQSAELLELAERSGLVHCTNFNIRFYPQVQQARALASPTVRSAPSGTCTAATSRTGCSLPTDWNWRLEPEKGGALRAVADIGSHWLDLVQFVTGMRVESLLADLATAIPRAAAADAARSRRSRRLATSSARTREMTTEDLAHILLRFEGDTRGSLVVSQVSAGRRNSLRFEVDGSEGAIAWDSERNEELWLGHRGRPNEVLPRDPALFAPEASMRTQPAGRACGGLRRHLQGALPGRVFGTSLRVGHRMSRTTRRSPTGTGRTCSATPSRSATVNVDGWR